MASLCLFLPLNHNSICKLNLPCDDGKLAEAAAELKSANPPNGSVDPPRNRRKPNAVTGLCKDPLQQLHVGFMKKSCSVFGTMGLLILLPKSVLVFLFIPLLYLYNNKLDYFQLPCRSCHFVFIGKN